MPAGLSFIDPPPGPWWLPGTRAELLGSHAGVWLWRLQGASSFILKLHRDRARGRREAMLLRALPSAGILVPALLEDAETDEGWILVMEDARRGRDGRLRRLDPGQAPLAARLLARVHACPVPAGLPDAADKARELLRRARAPGLPVALSRALRSLIPFGDALCHRDLHPSNWISEGGRPVGLLDWASAGMADPELDLAGLVLAAGANPSLIEPVCAAWERESGRPADRGRTALYLWLLLEEERFLSPGKSWIVEPLRILAEGAPWPVQGSQRVERVLPRQPGPLADGHWMRLPEEQAARVEALFPGARAITRYAGHACNDVFRFELDGQSRVLKVYNKPVERWLFDLELHLAQALAGSAAIVLPPLVLPGGGRVFRWEGRPAALYEDAGGVRLQNTPQDLVRLGRAQAALHRLTRGWTSIEDALGLALPTDLPPPEERLDRMLLKQDLEGRLAPELQARLWQAWPQVSEAPIDEPALPRALVHGSLHRDHTAWIEGRGLVLFDLEKARVGPRVQDLALAAIYVGYRGNDERPDPARLVRYLALSHEALPLDGAEKAALVPLILRALFHDLRALAQEGEPVEVLERHARVLLQFVHNRGHLEAAIGRYLR